MEGGYQYRGAGSSGTLLKAGSEAYPTKFGASRLVLDGHSARAGGWHVALACFGGLGMFVGPFCYVRDTENLRTRCH